MSQAIVALVLDEGKWLFASMLLALIIVLVALRQRTARQLSHRLQIIWAMNLFFACMIGTMAFGHLLAVTIKTIQGTIQGSWLILYPLGLILAIPAWWLVFRVAYYVTREDRIRMVALNAWLAFCLLALGLHNLPLAAPAALNIAYLFHRRRVVGWTIVTAALTANVGLFVGSIVFLASGQSFEQFQGMQ